ncbi:hypothetical protein A5714_02600 [Mycobacterium sp. E2462]|nr:hypothetical protein A5714_02600 [Mycobacterium sp. E2462]
MDCLTVRVLSSVSTSWAPASMASKVWAATSSGDSLGSVTVAVMSVSMKPGCTATTLVPCRCNSRRNALVSDHSAALDAQYEALKGSE